MRCQSSQSSRMSQLMFLLVCLSIVCILIESKHNVYGTSRKHDFCPSGMICPMVFVLLGLLLLLSITSSWSFVTPSIHSFLTTGTNGVKWDSSNLRQNVVHHASRRNAMTLHSQPQPPEGGQADGEVSLSLDSVAELIDTTFVNACLQLAKG